MGKEILNKRQVSFLEAFKNSELSRNFYLTGGTALAAFYLGHRNSEDLDFFSETEVEPLAVQTFLKSNKKGLGFLKLELQKSFNRNLFFLHFPREVLKTEFTYFPFERLGKGPKSGHLQVDSLRDIAVNKVFTITQQARARDFVDLYFIIKKTEWGLGALAKDVRIKFDTQIDPIQLGSELLKVRELKDFPRMRVPLAKKQLISFFMKEASALKNNILQ